MSEKPNAIKRIFYGRVNRSGFLLLTVILTLLVGFLGSIDPERVLKPFFILFYLTMVAARVRDWDGKPIIWVIIVSGIMIVSHNSFSSDMSAEDRAVFLLFYGGMLVIIHAVLMVRKGKYPNETYQNIKKDFSSNMKDRMELRRLKAEKKKLERKREIEKLRKEVE